MRLSLGRRSRLSPQDAARALAAGQCLYAEVSSCSGPAASNGLRHEDDHSAVLVCRAHYGRLRRANPDDLDELERYLRAAFRPALHFQPDDEDAVF